MGILKSAISQAVGGNDVKNGFNGPRMPGSRSSKPSYSRRDNAASYQQNSGDFYASNNGRGYDDQYNTASSLPRYDELYQASGFRPIVLPQISNGDGQPFLRGYSDELRRRNISQDKFISVVDNINVAIIPNPEVQLFQQGANIAGWFLPGAAGIGLMAGQVVVGAGNAFGKSSGISKQLAKANLEVFLPEGLEICIGKASNINDEVGFQPAQDPNAMASQRPEMRLAPYGNSVAPLTAILPPSSTGGRRDPIASMGNALSRRQAAKKMGKAQEDMAKGRRKKMNEMDSGLKWLIIRQAKPETLKHWQGVKQQADAADRGQQQPARYDESQKGHNGQTNYNDQIYYNDQNRYNDETQYYNQGRYSDQSHYNDQTYYYERR